MNMYATYLGAMMLIHLILNLNQHMINLNMIIYTMMNVILTIMAIGYDYLLNLIMNKLEFISTLRSL